MDHRFITLDFTWLWSMEDFFADLTTPLIADACVRLNIALRIAPSGIHPLVRGMRVAGRVLPARHRGSVDVFIEAMKKSMPGDVLVIDNQARTDESCIGDLTVLEAEVLGLVRLRGERSNSRYE